MPSCEGPANTATSLGVFGRAIAVDPQGNSYLTGGFQYEAVFGDVTFPNKELSDAFVAKYEPDGKLHWAVHLGGDADDLATGIGVAVGGGCYVTGYFSEDPFFGDELLTSVAEVDLFLVRIGSEGHLEWVRQAGEVGMTQGASVSVDCPGKLPGGWILRSTNHVR